MDKVSRGITLTLTENCNLDCIYCYEHNKSCKKMSFETAKEIIDSELGSSKDEIVTIDFFGGEPFLEFDLLKKVCEYTWSKSWNSEYHFFASSNGTLIHGEIKDWLIEHKEQFWCGISYDGTPSMNDTNRNNSSSMIDLDFFVNTWPTQGVKMTVSKDTLPFLAEGVIFLQEKGFIVNCNLAYGLDWNYSDWSNIYQQQLLQLVDYYLSHPNIDPCSMLNMDIVYVNEAETLKYTKWCGAGTNMKVFAPDGICYPCHYFEPLSIGEDKAKQSLLLDFSENMQLMDENCANCCLQPICPTCYGSNFAATGDIRVKDRNLCSLTKLQAMANSYFWYKKLNQYTDEELGITKERRKLITDAIIKIQNSFSEI